MDLYNIFTCSAPPGAWSTGLFGGCSQAWLILFIAFMLIMILRRQCDDGIISGAPFNFIGALIAGLLAPIVVITLTGIAKWGLLAAIIGIGVGGFALGFIFPSMDSGGGE